MSFLYSVNRWHVTFPSLGLVTDSITIRFSISALFSFPCLIKSHYSLFVKFEPEAPFPHNFSTRQVCLHQIVAEAVQKCATFWPFLLRRLLHKYSPSLQADNSTRPKDSNRSKAITSFPRETSLIKRVSAHHEVRPRREYEDRSRRPREF